MATTMCQCLGFGISALGFAGTIVATALNMWSTQDLGQDLVTSIYKYMGLWKTCMQQTSGYTECRPFYTVLGLPATFQAVRALMIVAIVLALIGSGVSIISLKCIRLGSMDDASKANLTLTSGILFIVAGVCCIAGVSIYGNMLVTNFWEANMSMLGNQGSVQQRYTFGSALFIGWVSGGLLVIGGIVMCIACRGLVPEEARYNSTIYKLPSGGGPYKTGYKASTHHDMEMTHIRKSYPDDIESKKSGYNRNTEDSRRAASGKYDYV
ncbi:claudin-18-like [Chiloscyllium plagiosum]|uniref:claudin-18-like n=1 Tax=Chiloscyllium plagiosum TaxID=36176 RepID=UPI001CB82142|nr:claudin-18-like [Chiloscyllium plagiosum]